MTAAGRLRAGRGAAARARSTGGIALLVSCSGRRSLAERIERLGTPGETGTFVFSVGRDVRALPSPDGPIAAPDGPLGTLYAGKLLERPAGSWQFIAFRGDGDRDFLGELTDPLPVTVDAEGQLLVEYPRIPTGANGDARPGDPVAPRLGREPRRDSRVAATARAPRGDPGRARPRAAAPRESSSSRVGATLDERVRVDGGEIRLRLFTPVGAGAASGVRPLPRRWLRLRHDRLARQRRQVRAHLPGRRAARSRRSTTGSRPSIGSRPQPRTATRRSRWLAANAGRLGIDPDAYRRRWRVGRRQPRSRRRAHGPRSRRSARSRSSCSRSRSSTSAPAPTTIRRSRSSARATVSIAPRWTFYAQEYLADLDRRLEPVRLAAPCGRPDGRRAGARDDGRVRHASRQRRGVRAATRAAGVGPRFIGELGHTHGSSVLWQDVGTGARVDGRGRRCPAACSDRPRRGTP